MVLWSAHVHKLNTVTGKSLKPEKSPENPVGFGGPTDLLFPWQVRQRAVRPGAGHSSALGAASAGDLDAHLDLSKIKWRQL